jgi:hypothetical protein
LVFGIYAAVMLDLGQVGTGPKLIEIYSQPFVYGISSGSILSLAQGNPASGSFGKNNQYDVPHYFNHINQII